MESNNRKRSRKSKLVLRQVVELDEELQKILDISQDITKPEENYLNTENGDYFLEIKKEEIDIDIANDSPPEFHEEEDLPALPEDILEKGPTDYVIPKKLPKLVTTKPDEATPENDNAVNFNDHTYSMQETSTNIQFSVNIEVEEFDDENIDTDSLNIDETCDYGYRTHEISVRKDLFIDPNNEPKKLDLPKHVVNNIIVGKPNFDTRIEALPEHIVNSIILGDDYQKNDDVTKFYTETCAFINDPKDLANELQNYVNEHWSPADDYLKNFALNNLVAHFNSSELSNPIDLLFQSAITTWTVWYRITKNLPTYYKCYVCTKAWWFLNDLRQHVIDESHDVKVDMEINDALCNIIAYDKNLVKPPSYIEIPVEGRCVSCHREFNDHLMVTCVGCKYKFATCTLFVKHLNQCKKYIEKTGKVAVKFCELCVISFFDEIEFEEHFKTMHTVRSDLPVTFTSKKKCIRCDKLVSYLKHHECYNSKAARHHRCKNCNLKFTNAYNTRKHIQFQYAKCPVCGIKFITECIILKHVLLHTANFKFAVRCVDCEKFVIFNDLSTLREHVRIVHTELSNDRKAVNAQAILLPKEIFNKYKSIVTYAMDKNDKIINKTIDKADKDELENIIKQTVKKEPKPGKSLLKPQKQRKLKTPQKKVIIPQRPSRKPRKTVPKPETKQISPKPNEESTLKVPNGALLSVVLGGSNGDAGEETAPCEEDGLDLVKVKTEIKEEPFDYDLFSDSIGMSFLNDESITNTNQPATVEPEIILGEMILKRTYCCKQCGFIGYHKQYKEHLSNTTCKKHRNKTKTELNNTHYPCTKCSSSFKKPKAYILHLTKHGFKLRCCPECLKPFPTNSRLMYHIQTHIKDLYLRLIFLTDDQMKQKFCYQCRICRVRITENEFFEHWESHLEFKLKCEGDVNETDVADMGSMSEIDVSRLNSVEAKFRIEPKHLKIIFTELQKSKASYARFQRYTCVICARSFNRKTDIKRHYIQHLLMEACSKKPRNNGLKCQICGAVYPKADRYKLHMRNHACLPIYRCEICNKSFSDSSNFAKHKKVHNVQVLICDHCGKKFHKKDMLAMHMQLHMKNQFFTCSTCEETFLTLASRNKHVKKVHDNIKPTYPCMICREAFISVKLKWDHEWTVHKQRQVKADCPKCGHKFRRITDVKRHLAEAHSMHTVMLYGENGMDEIQITVD